VAVILARSMTEISSSHSFERAPVPALADAIDLTIFR
jgi:hypothetical protein